jgi:hypothetical protein
MWVWFAAAQAEPIGHWHPDDLAPRSTVFRSSSEKLQEPFGARSSTLEQLATALREYREGLDLLGASASAAERERLDQLEKAFERQRVTLQTFADELVADYDEAFMAAVKRALATHGGEIEECPDQVADGPSIPGLPSRARKNPDCHGPDLNVSLATTVDSDSELTASLSEILSRPWPAVALERAPQATVGGTDRWMLVRDLFVAGAREELKAIDQEDDQARMRIEAAIEGGASTEELKKLEPEVQRIEAETAARRAALAGPVLAVVDTRIAKKWAGEASTGWCAQPVLLGGCAGKDATKELVSRLLDDPKVDKALDKASF